MTRQEQIEKAATAKSRGETPYYYDAFIAGAEWADAHPHWISVADELPKKREDVLVFTSQKSIQIAQLRYPETADWWDNDGRYMQNNKPTHWMPMPKNSNSENIGKDEKGGEE